MCSVEVPARSETKSGNRALPTLSPWRDGRLTTSVLQRACMGSAIAALILSPWLIVWWMLADLSGWPLNDDPFYTKPLALWASDGRLQLVRQYGYLTASSVAHIATGLLAAFDGLNFRQLFLICIVQQALGALALYWLARRLQLSHAVAAVCSLSLVTYPLYFGHAFTYMTDGPATAWSSLACCLLTIGLAYRQRAFIAAGALAIGWGYWTRQTNGALLMAPCMVSCLYLWKEYTSTRKILWPLTLALVMIGALESGWVLPTSASRINDVAPQAADGYWKRSLIATYGWLLLLGWYLLPIAPWLIQQAWIHAQRIGHTERWMCRLGAMVVFLGGALPLLLTAGRAHLTSATGSFIQNGHFGPIFLSDMDEPGRWGTLGGVVWPVWTWQLLSWLSVVSAASMGWWMTWTVLQVAKHRFEIRNHPLILMAFAWLVMIGISVALLASCIEPHLDRYWLFLMPVVTVYCLLLAAQQRWQLNRAVIAWSVLCIAAQWGMSTVYVHDMLAWNNARWQYVQQHLAAGRSAQTIDAGRDVNAWLRMDEDPDTSARPGDNSRWWSGHAIICIATGPRPGWHVHERLPWQSWATGQTHFLLVLKADEKLRDEDFSVTQF